MNYYICIISDYVDSSGHRTSGEKIYNRLMSKSMWGLHPRTASRANLKEGDQIVFYLSGRHQVFLGTAVVSSIANFDKESIEKNLFLDPTTQRVNLSDIVIWKKPKPIRPLLKKISFIKNNEVWGPYLQGGARKISESDFKVIVQSEEYDEGFAEKTLSDTVIAFNPASAAYSPHALTSPERIKISRIIENVQKGWKIPNFQRYFDWNKEDVRSFLESIFNDYYVGSFLLWEVSNDTNLVIEPIKGVKDSGEKVNLIILDGQQRMTALYYAIKTPNFGLKGGGNKSSYYYIDLKAFIEDGGREDVVITKDIKLSREESYDALLFPFYHLENLPEWIDGFEDFLENQTYDKDLRDNQIKNIRRTVEKRLRHIWEGFEIPYVTLPSSMDLSHVANVFEKINTKGKPLNTFDLLIARLLKYGIKLKDLWDKARDDYPSTIQRYDESTDKTRMSIFQAMSLLYHPASSTKRKDLLNIYENISISNLSQFLEYWNEFVSSLDKAISHIENMRDGLGVRSEKDVPFIPALPMLSAFFAISNEFENQQDIFSKIHQWYWSACVTGAYSSSADSQMSADFKEVTRWFKNEDDIPNIVIKARSELINLNLLEVSEESSAIYRAILSLIALKGAKDFVTSHNLENARENQKDHIFPKSSTKGFGKYQHVDSVLNMTWMSGVTNMRIKKAKKPAEYIPDFIKDNFANNKEKFIDVLQTHYIDEACFEALKQDKFDQFLNKRKLVIMRVLKNKIGASTEVEEKVSSNPDEFINELEIKIRTLIDKKLKENYPDYWDIAIPQGVRERVREKVSYYVNKHPGESSKKFSAFDRLNFCDITDYHEIITYRQNWPIFESIFGKKSEIDKHFGNIKEYRNCIKHTRPMNVVTRKLGEGSFEWIHCILNNQ